MQPIIHVRDVSTKEPKQPRRPTPPSRPFVLTRKPVRRATEPPVKAEELKPQLTVEEDANTAFLTDTAGRLSADWQGSHKPHLEYVPPAAETFEAAESPESLGLLPIEPEIKPPRWVGKSF